MLLQSERILLRKFDLRDFKKYYLATQDEEIKTFLPYAYGDTLEITKNLIRNYSGVDFKNDFYFAIEDKESNNIIGAILAFRSYRIDLLDVSYFISKSFRGHEYCLEALKIFCEFLRLTTNYVCLEFAIRPENSNSKNVMKKLGSKEVESDIYHYCI